jgi:hypothetical protein
LDEGSDDRLASKAETVAQKSNATITNVGRQDPASAMWIGQFRKRRRGSIQ